MVPGRWVRPVQFWVGERVQCLGWWALRQLGFGVIQPSFAGVAVVAVGRSLLHGCRVCR